MVLINEIENFIVKINQLDKLKNKSGFSHFLISWHYSNIKFRLDHLMNKNRLKSCKIGD